MKPHAVRLGMAMLSFVGTALAVGCTGHPQAAPGALARQPYDPGMGSGMMGRPAAEAEMMKQGAAGTPPAEARLASGSAIFSAHCTSCHRDGGNVMAPDLPVRGSPRLADFATFLAFIRHPTMPDGSSGAMPDFTESDLSGRQVADLYQYISATQWPGDRAK